MKTIATLFLFIFACIAGISTASEPSSIFTSKTYRIEIADTCGEGELNCQRLRVTCHNLLTGKRVRLIGRNVVHHCPDDQGDGPSQTICHHVGYEFKYRAKTYFLTDSGELEVIRGNSSILSEKGSWIY